MNSPAKRHMQRMLAKQQAEQAADPGSTTRADANQYELMLAQLHDHRLQLKNIESITTKIARKAELLPDYAPYIDGILAANTGQQDDVLMTVLVWRIDTADWSGALAIAAYAIEHNLTLPDTYKRNTACLIAEEIADAAIKAIRADDEFEADTLQRIMLITDQQDMPDQVRAKLHKALGYALETADPEQALIEFNRAVALNDKAGVKKDIERIERAIKNKDSTGTAGQS
tara:strand:+ start:1931 stop:2617 length:687 start_codon:yes stop_codon:yes gene_type:complete